MALYNHGFSICFSVTNVDAEGNCPADVLRAAIVLRLALLSDDELLEAVGAPFDTTEIGDA